MKEVQEEERECKETASKRKREKDQKKREPMKEFKKVHFFYDRCVV